MKIIIILIFLLFPNYVYALKNIKVNNENLSPLFDENTHVYNYFTNKDSIKITVEKEENEKVSGYGIFSAIDGKNEFIVKSNDKKYIINVFKNYKIIKDYSTSLLNSISIENYDINFDPNVFEYNIDAINYEKLNISYIPGSEYETILIKNNNESSNVVEIIVTSGDKKNESIYKINMNKTAKTFKINKDEVVEYNYYEKKIVMIVIITISSSLVLILFKFLFTKRNNQGILHNILRK